MLFPQNNSYRHYVDLNGLWEFRRDLEQQGEAKGWGGGFAPEGLLAVPASWTTSSSLRKCESSSDAPSKWEKADQMIAAADRADRRLGVIFQKRFNPAAGAYRTWAKGLLPFAWH